MFAYFNNLYFLKDNGHNHNIDLNTEAAGVHNHGYKDIFYSQSVHYLDYVPVPGNLGSGAQPDRDNFGHQIDRGTNNAGDHNHLLRGPTWHNSASLTYTGGNQPFDNRPLYAVIQYIIYIEN
jgi:hypothetical protein